MELENRVEAFVQKHGLFARGSCIVIACSGGPDSLALASVLLALREKWRLSLCVAHFEHGIRGAASRADESFVRTFAEENALPYKVAHENIPNYAKHARLSLETAARQRRYAFLEKTARGLGDGALIATGHHAGDQAETVLMQILRGSGVDGLAGIRPRTGNRVRPLLFLSREDILAYLTAKGLVPRWDETNFVPCALRNRMRYETLPALRRYNPSAEAALCRLAAAQAELSDFLRFSVEAVWGKAVARKEDAISLRRDCYREQPTALRKAILRRLSEEAGLRQSLEFSHYEALDRFCRFGEAGKRLTLPEKYVAECRYDRIILSRMPEKDCAWEEVPLSLEGATRIDAIGLTVYAFPWEPGTTLPDALTAVADVDALESPLFVRGRQDGDSFRLENGKRQKIKSLLIDRKVPRAFRERVPIFTADGEIFWVGGLRRAAVALLTEKTKRAVAFQIEWDVAAEQEKERTGHEYGCFEKRALHGGADCKTGRRIGGRADKGL